MISSKHLKTLGSMPWERFATTYSSDYKPLSGRHLQVNQLKHRTEIKAAPVCFNPPQTGRNTWPVFHQYFYKTTNSTYGSGSCSQPPSRSLFPASLSPSGILTPSDSEASRVIGSALTAARTQEVGIALQPGPLLGEEEKGRLHYVFGGKANALKQHEARGELQQQKIDVLYEEGVIVLSSHVSPACCKDFLRSVCRQAGLQHLLHPPVASSPIITIKDAENLDYSACLRGFRLQNSSFLQSTFRQCSCCAWEAECPNDCCFRMQTGIPCGGTLPLARGCPTVYCTEPCRKPLLTEYQASYTAQWAQPKIQQSDFHHCHRPRHQIPYHSL